MTPPPRILIAGIGNIFLGDDAFGVQVAQKLMHERFPPEVRVVDFGIRGLDLVYALLDGCELAILIDAVPRGEAPGTLFTIEPDIAGLEPESDAPAPIEAHSMDPLKVLRTVKSMGPNPNRVLIVGCEPTPIGANQDMQMELSLAVVQAIEPAVEMVRSLVAEHLSEHPKEEIYHAQHEPQPQNIGSPA